MCDSDRNDDSWENFFGTSTELMPSIMGAFDTLIESNRTDPDLFKQHPRRAHPSGNFAALSPCVLKILSNVADQELARNFASEETLVAATPKRGPAARPRAFKSPEKHLNRSNESLDIISPAVQKMISNFPDTELVIAPSPRNSSAFLHTSASCELFSSSSKLSYSDSFRSTGTNSSTGSYRTSFFDSNSSADADKFENNNNNNRDVDSFAESECESFCAVEEQEQNCKNGNSGSECSPVPLGSYLHTSHGIASRTPVGRKNIGKYLQVPSESSMGTNSTTSSEVSRPVSLTSLGSCSSSGSSGPHQPSSAYLASAESLDSDPEPTGSQGSADSGIAEQTTMSPESRVLQEVLDTETVYVEHLGEVIQGYLEPWKQDPECPLTEHLPNLFSNLEEIHKFNNSFLDQLREADFNPTKIANVFIQNDSGFTVYNEYCTYYPKTMQVLGELTGSESTASLFREKQLALGHALPLGSYLLKPVQRILKYHLLLQRLSKQCEPLHKPAVDLALTTMTSVASNINNMKRKHEHAVRVHEIQSQLYGWTGPDLTTLGELIAEGTFRVNGAKGRRYVCLFDKVLMMAKNKQDGVLAYKSHIMCSNLMLVEQVRGEPLSFQVLPFDNPRLQCTLRARSPQHKREWTLQIKRVILENYSAVIPNHARQLVMQLGQEVHETEDSDKWSPLNKISTPHYLERRSRVRKSRDLSSRRASSQDRSFPSLGGWRRKSEPSMAIIPQYNTKTMPKKISKLKKAKETETAKFYTDLSDSENCESSENLASKLNESLTSVDKCGETINEEAPSFGENKHAENNLEKIVSDLLMQQEEFQKVMNRPRRGVRGSEPCWYEESRPKVPSKADSLPRSFQLNDQIDSAASQVGGNTDSNNSDNAQEKRVLDESLKKNPDVDEQHENDLGSQLDDNDYPVHKIYRKSAIRFSLVQRIRALVSESDENKPATSKYPLRKQGSKSMGEKIAHPDYADPQKLFASASCNSSRTNLSLELTECEIMAEPERLDMTISENEVLNELEKRLNGNNGSSDSSSSPVDSNNSSQNSDSYYESMLDKNLVEEYTKDASGRLVAKQDSFKNVENTFYIHKYNSSRKEQQALKEVNGNGCSKTNKNVIKRPSKAPPPIPTKPTRFVTKIDKSNNVKATTTSLNKSDNGNANTESEKSWVKAMVGRFE